MTDWLPFFSKAPWYTKRGAFLISVGLAGISFAGLLALSEMTNLTYPLWVVASCTPLPSLIFLIVVLFRRSWLGVRMSNMTKIVLAYNLSSVPNRDEVEEQYRIFAINLEKNISLHGLGEFISVEKKHTDIKFKSNSAAEAKTQLGLEGNTVLIWGTMEKHKKRTVFRTSVSYEFSYPTSIEKSVAEATIGRSVKKALDIGIFAKRDLSLTKNVFDLDDSALADESFMGILFILGVVSSSYQVPDKTIKLFELFINLYKSESDRAKKSTLTNAYAEAQELLSGIYIKRGFQVLYHKKGHWLELKELTSKLIAQDDNETRYRGYTWLSIAEWNMGNRDAAIQANIEAAQVARKNDYIHRFNFAFFNIWEGEYEKLLSIYEGTPVNIDINAAFTSESLFKAYEESKNPAFVFAEGYIIYKYGTKFDGITRLEEFLKLPRTKESEFDILREKAEWVIARHTTKEL